MGQVIALQEWRRRHAASAARARDLSLPWQAPPFFWPEPMLVSSLTVWRAAAVTWAGLALAAADGLGFPPAGRGALAAAPLAALAPFGTRP